MELGLLSDLKKEIKSLEAKVKHQKIIIDQLKGLFKLTISQAELELEKIEQLEK